MKKCLFILMLLPFLAVAQRNVKDSVIATPYCAIHYGINQTYGDLSERFGILNHIGGLASWKTSRNLVLGFEGNFIFGSQVKTKDLFANLVDANGNIYDESGEVGLVVVNARGFNIDATIGKVFPILSPNENSGLFVHGGIGYIQHKIRVETQEQYIPTLETVYRKGYDRYTTGFNFHEFVGYSFLANQGVVNFYGGFYFSQGLTKNRREVFFDQPDTPVPTNWRLDGQMGIKLGWFIPVYERKPKEFYYD